MAKALLIIGYTNDFVQEASSACAALLSWDLAYLWLKISRELISIDPPFY